MEVFKLDPQGQVVAVLPVVEPLLREQPGFNLNHIGNLTGISIVDGEESDEDTEQQ